VSPEPGYPLFRAALLAAYRRALAQVLPPGAAVARHWEDASRLHWLGLFQEQGRFQLSWSFGRLRPPAGAEPHTAGVFSLVDPVFPGVEATRLAAMLVALAPAASDGPTRAFLTRVVGQLALAEVAAALWQAPASLGMPTAPNFTVALPVRADAPATPAPTPRVPPHARERVEAGLEALETPLRRSLERLFAAPEAELLLAVLAWTPGHARAARGTPPH
jgi:hypothetical protein